MGGSKHSISPEGKAEAEAELQDRRDVKRPKIVAEIKAAREFGDLSENAEYHAAREAQGLNEARIRVSSTTWRWPRCKRARRCVNRRRIACALSRLWKRRGHERNPCSPVGGSVTKGKISIESPVAQRFSARVPGSK